MNIFDFPLELLELTHVVDRQHIKFITNYYNTVNCINNVIDLFEIQ